MAFNGENPNQGGYNDDEFEFIDPSDNDGISIDDIDYNYHNDDDDDDDSKNQYPSKDNDKNNNQSDDDNNEDVEPSDLITEFLKSKGINDKNLIKFENEKGEIEEYSFDDLTLEEQLEILGYQDSNESNNDSTLNDDEQQFFDHLKENNVSVSEYLEYYKQLVLDEFQSSQEYSQIDELSSDELYIHDLKQRFPNFTEEELLEELNVAKSNEGVFERKVESLKDHYKKLEEDHLEQQKELDLQNQQKQQEEIQRMILDASKDVKEISVIELENDDIQAALDVIFQEDTDGNTALNKALNDPKTLVEIAWFISKGKDSMDTLAAYYRNIIKQQDDVLKKSQKTKTTVIKKSNNNSSTGKKKIEKSIDDIEF